MSLRERYEEKWQAQLHELKAEAHKLKEKADLAETSLQLEYYTLIDELHLKLEIAEQKFELLKQTKGKKWEAVKTDFELSWKSLQELIKAITSP